MLEGAAIEDGSVPVKSVYQGQAVIDLPFNGEIKEETLAPMTTTHISTSMPETLLPLAMVYEEVAKGDYTPASVRVVKEFGEYEFLPGTACPTTSSIPRR